MDLNRLVLTIRNTKFGKTRLVPVGLQLSRALIQYNSTRPTGRAAEAPFFATRRGGIVSHGCCIGTSEPSVIEQASVELMEHICEPRIHDLRHTFAVHRLTSWYQHGADVQQLLHHLSVYLGHVHLRCTQVYLSMTPELLQEASKRFERYAGKEGDHE